MRMADLVAAVQLPCWCKEAYPRRSKLGSAYQALQWGQADNPAALDQPASLHQPAVYARQPALARLASSARVFSFGLRLEKGT